MQDERADEFLSWRGRLAQPDALPGQGLDHPEAVWDRLNARLRRGAGQDTGVVHGEPAIREGGGRPGKPNRYVIAAALLLLLAVPATLLYRGTVPAGAGAVPGRSLKSGLPAGGLAGGNDGGSGDASPTIKDNLAATRPAGGAVTPGKNLGSGLPGGGLDGGSRARKAIVRPAMIKPEERPVALVTTAPATTPSTLPDSGARLAVLTTPVRKPLRVVSINEIDHPGTTGPSMTAQWPATHFRITLTPRGNALPPESALEEKGSTLLKIKLTP